MTEALMVNGERTADGKGDKHDNPKGMRFAIEWDVVVFKVHTIGRENHSWNGHNDRYQGQSFHNVVLVIGNNGRKGICHPTQDISVNICHLDGLLGLNQGVF